jgi:hypothetical protein
MIMSVAVDDPQALRPESSGTPSNLQDIDGHLGFGHPQDIRRPMTAARVAFPT